MRIIIVLLLFVAGCGGSDQTCVRDRVSYAGAADGQVLVKVSYSTMSQVDTRREIISYPTVAAATNARQSAAGGACWTGAIGTDPLAQAVAWIDVGDRLPPACGGISFDECAPQPGDPQAKGTFTLGNFMQNYLDLMLKDP
jgi:hypothetical protein